MDAIDAGTAAEYSKLALGCPAMGAEVLEESEFEPWFSELEGRLSGHQVALFGSYGWGDGQWLRDWAERSMSTTPTGNPEGSPLPISVRKNTKHSSGAPTSENM